jgi:hypothetical protein
MDQQHDDSSHYEVSLTAGQALIAFVLLLSSLAASFAFGVIVGKGRNDERLVVRREPAVVSEASSAGSRAPASRIVELGVDEVAPTPVITTDTTSTVMLENPPLVEEAPPATATTTAPEPGSGGDGPFYAQLLSTSEAKTAESLAARLIDNGFTTAYVDRFISEQGTVFRVRVRFPTEAAARAAADQLKTYSRGDVWITRQ